MSVFCAYGVERFSKGGEMSYARDNSPEHASSSGDSPIELQIAAAAKRPVDALLMVASSQHAPTMRVKVKRARKRKPLFVFSPCRTTKNDATKKDGA